MAKNILKIVDITFVAKDVKRTADFYAKVGLRKLLDEGDGLQVFRLGDKELAIHREMPEEGEIPSPNTVHISCVVADLKKLLEDLDNNGVQYTTPKGSHLGAEAVHVTDPDGNHIEFHQKK